MDISKPDNQVVYTIVTDFIVSFLSKKKKSTIQRLIDEFEGPTNIKEWEIRFIINKLIRNENLKKTETNDNQIEIELNKPLDKVSFESSTKVVISLPRLRELGLYDIQERNQYVETKECFTTLISSATNSLRICSPFMESNVLSEDSFPELGNLFLNALDKGVRIKILSREIFARRSREMKWLIDIAKESRNPKMLTIADYHVNRGQTVFSSAHAKLIISDQTSAYIGSAELRRNSLIANFEVGCYITGPQITGICELFDLMYKKGDKWF